MENNQKPCTDHLGNHFQSLTALLNHYDVAKTTFHRKTKEGIPLCEILTKWSRKSNKCEDHLGNTFESITSMLKFYNVSESVYLYGVKNNIPLETILTKNRHNSTDHTGKTFKTMIEMCKHWGISKNIVKKRLKDGWSLEKALTEPPRRPFSFPRILYEDVVQQKITIRKHIDDDFFLCTISNSNVILTKKAIIKLANKIYKNNKERSSNEHDMGTIR